MECPKCQATIIGKEGYMTCLNQYCGFRIPCCEELEKTIAKLERIIERLVADASFNACQPSRRPK